MLPDPTFGLLVGDEYTEKAVPLPDPRFLDGVMCEAELVFGQAAQQ